MNKLTAKEEEIMGFFWEKGPLFVRQLLEFYKEPRPHFNTLSTIVRGLEEKGFPVSHFVWEYLSILCRGVCRRLQASYAEGYHQQIFQ